jgi:hypothetical protein
MAGKKILVQKDRHYIWTTNMLLFIFTVKYNWIFWYRYGQIGLNFVISTRQKACVLNTLAIGQAHGAQVCQIGTFGVHALALWQSSVFSRHTLFAAASL